MAMLARPLSLFAILLVAAPLCAGEPELQRRADHAMQRIQAMRTQIGLGELDHFSTRAVHDDELGQTHTRLQQYHQGVRVWGGEAIIHAGKDGEDLPPTLAHRRHVFINVTPSLGESEVLGVVHGDLAPQGTYAYAPRAELVILPVETRAVTPNRRKVRTDGVGDAAGMDDTRGLDATAFETRVLRYVLAYHVRTEIENPGETRHTDYMVDAHTGAILEKWDSLQTSNAVGTGNSQYSGTVQLNTNTTASGFELRDNTRPVSGGNTVNDMNHSTSGIGTVYTDADNTWGDGLDYREAPEPTTSANGQTVAVDAAFGLQAAWDMYKNIHGRNGLDGLGHSVYAKVHYDNGYDNAFYSDQCMCITFGDGTKRLPYTPLDIAAHEFSHGVCSTTAGLIYNKESGGLNESNSDIMGVMTEFYYRGANGQGSVIPDTGGNWTQGEQIATPASPQFRRMYKPSLDGKSADAWSSTLSTLNVHYSSGPMNRCFYFISQGATTSGDTSTTFLPGGMTGIGNQKAAKIWYRALTTYMTPSTDYAAARIACIQAVRDLYPLSGPEEIAVWNAFAGINVGGPWAGADAAPVVVVSESGAAGTVTFSATATDDKGVTKVDFLLDGLLVGTKAASPYTMTYDSLMQDDGTHTLDAKATDTVGLFTNATMDFLINNGQLIKNGSFEKGYGVGWSNTSGMEIGAILNTPPYDGTKCAKFRGRGSAGSVAIFQNVAIPATAASATLSFALHIETKETTGGLHDTFAVQIRNTAGAILQTLATYSNLNAAAGYTVYNFNVAAFKGQTVQVYFLGTEDSAISTGFILDKVNLVVVGGGPADTTPPSVSATESGTAGAITLAATATDASGVSKAEFYVDGALKGTDTASPFTMALDSTTLANGSHSLVAKAYDPSGNVGSSTSVAFTINNADTQAPSVSVSESGSTGILSFSATASDNIGVTKVDFYVDGVLKGTDATAPYGMSLDSATLANGSHTLVGKAYDAAGNIGTSTGFAFTVGSDTTAPIVTASESGTAGTITFSATASDASGVAKVDFYVDGVLKGTDTTSPYSMTLDSTTLTNASHALVAKASDPVGNIGTSTSVTFTISNPPPSSTYNEVESNGTTTTANIAADTVTKIVGYIGTSTDQDFFKINVAAGRTVTVNMTGPARDYDLYLLSSTGGVLRTSAGSTATESVSYTNATAATAIFYIKVVALAAPLPQRRPTIWL
ncbi:MAG: M4 family metallopeptidase [Holophagaceae bacterium]|nr:M4 family metallopeptidase [Holophagaceae bacterium]